MAMNFPTPTQVGEVYTDANGNVYVCTVLGPPAQWVGSGSSTSLDNTYLRKDASNDPVTGQLVITPASDTTGLVVTQPSGNTTAAMRITNEGSGNSLVIEDSANPDSTPIVADPDGKWLVGISTSRNNLGGGTQSAALQIEGTSFDSTNLSIVRNLSSSLGTPNITLGKSRGSSVGSNTAVTSGDDLGGLFFEGADGTNFVRAANILSAADGSVSTGIVPGRLEFHTANTSGTLTENMRLSSTGALGVCPVGISNLGSGYGVVVGTPSGGSGGIYAVSNQNVFGTGGSAGYVVARGIAGGSGSSVIDTGISINASIGKSLLILASRNTSNGTATDSALYFVQFYQSGNNAPAVTFVAGDANFVTFGVSASNTLTVNGNAGNWSLGGFVSN